MLYHVALLTPPYSVLTYAAPAWLPESIWRTGLRVAVPLRNGAFRAGVITACDVSLPEGIEAKPLAWPLERAPLLDDDYLRMVHQLAIRQLQPDGRILGNVLPQGLRTTQNIRIRRFLDSQKPKFYKLRDIGSLSEDERTALGADYAAGKAEVLALAEDTAASELVQLNADPPWRVRANAQNQLKLLDYIWNNAGKTRRQLMDAMPECRDALNSLIKSGILKIAPMSAEQDEQEAEETLLPPPVAPFQLTAEQRTVVKNLEAALNSGQPSTQLLFGITGSGKTAIYLELAQKCLSLGKSVLLLAPEVGIALKLRRDAQERGLPVVLSHGYQNPRRRERIFREAAENASPSLVIGTRSALFLPLHNIGLVILDEEHDNSFKQDEGLPYHAKDVAWFRARQNHALFLMGSATPDIKSFYAAKQGAYPLLRLENRVGGGSLPEIRLVDINHCRSALAPESILALKDTVQRGEQAIIMLNRRGYAPLMYCLDCNETIRCPNCDISLSYHKRREQLVCHYCGYTRPFPSPCPKCGGGHLLPMGEGTEKIEEALGSLTDAKILRMDSDSTRREGRMEEILTAFARGEAQILVGTQMLSKGHHFPNVTLALIADADLGLNFPDYRAVEHTFQLLVQAAGRAGRGEKKGAVLIQTRDPQHYCWDFVRSGNYEAFYENEIALRKKRRYPPFVKLALIRGSWRKDQPESEAIWQSFSRALKTAAQTSTEFSVLGPSPAPLGFLQGRVRFQFLIKGNDWSAIRTIFSTACAQTIPKNKPDSLRIDLDLDPVNML